MCWRMFFLLGFSGVLEIGFEVVKFCWVWVLILCMVICGCLWFILWWVKVLGWVVDSFWGIWWFWYYDLFGLVLCLLG